MRQGTHIGTLQTETGATAAPSTANDGVEIKHTDLGGTKLNADEITLVATFTGGTTPTATVVPYLYFPAHDSGKWTPGAQITLKETPDADYGMIANIAGVGAATRIYIRVTALTGTPTNIKMTLHHNEHSEAI